jgi:hypothetical protein
MVMATPLEKVMAKASAKIPFMTFPDILELSLADAPV